MRNLRALFKNVADVVQNAQPHGCGEFVELGIDADTVDAVDPGNTEIAQQMSASGQFVIVGDDRAAFNGVKQLGRMKAQGADIAMIEHRLAAWRTPNACARHRQP